MAAGIGSRYGGLKQIDSFGPNGEAIMDYSIYDAIQSGFDEVIFIIQENMIKDLYEKFSHNFDGKIKVSHVIQSTEIEVNGDVVSRKRPWGTAHAILSSKSMINEPFLVINADDFYGTRAFRQVTDFILDSKFENEYALVGYRLGNTLSDSGSVARGVCQTNGDGFLSAIEEKTKISKEGDLIINQENEEKEILSPETVVSMNFWAFRPSIFNHIQSRFDEFILENSNSEKAELFIPNVLNELLRLGSIKIKVIESVDPWFGVTYKSDKSYATSRIDDLIKDGTYPEKLWS